MHRRAGQSGHARRCSASTPRRPTTPGPSRPNWNATSSRTGFFRNKAKSIQNCCQTLLEKYDGQVPKEMEKLVELPGVGRKTANVVLGTAFGIAVGVVVDTHVARITRRLGLTAEKDPVKIERDLMDSLPRRSGSR